MIHAYLAVISAVALGLSRAINARPELAERLPQPWRAAALGVAGGAIALGDALARGSSLPDAAATAVVIGVSAWAAASSTRSRP